MKNLVGKIADMEDSSFPNIILGVGKLNKSDVPVYIVTDISLDEELDCLELWAELEHLDKDVISCDYIVTKEEFISLYNKHPLSNVGWSYSKDFTLWPFKQETIFQLSYKYE